MDKQKKAIEKGNAYFDAAKEKLTKEYGLNWQRYSDVLASLIHAYISEEKK